MTMITEARIATINGSSILIMNVPYACEFMRHLMGSTEDTEPPMISAGRFTTSLKIALPFALKIPRMPSICK